MEEQYTFKQIYKKFGWTTKITSNTVENQIQFAKNRGCIIELANNKKPHTFKIISEPPAEEEWFPYPQNNKYEITKKGMVRNKKTKRILGSTDSYGYQTITDTSQTPLKRYKIHRMVLETFNPIENAEMYVVDHINGIKNDNRLENLRWLTQRHNMEERDENYAKLNENYQKLIQKYGYEGLNHIFLTILNEK